MESLARSGAVLMVPPLLLSLSLWPLLPEAYQPEHFGRGLPPSLGWTENLLRVLVFALPITLRARATTPGQRTGRSLYLVGLLLYALSYLLLTGEGDPGSPWATSWLGFTAPAWTPALWLAGIALMCREHRPAQRRWWGFCAASVAFLAAHVAHASLVWASVY